MDYETLTEGRTVLRVPVGGGISSGEEVFYNPHMRLNRSLTVLMAKYYGVESFLDLMGASGARGVRVANEAFARTHINDLNPLALALAGENASLNNLDIDFTSLDARSFWTGERFDFVDLDPFGTPAPYIDAAVNLVRINGILGVCATDKSALCGAYPKACQRKYDAMPLRCDCLDEIGLRIFLGFIARCCMRHDRGVLPLFSHSTRHYIRCQVRVTGKAGDAFKNLRYLRYCPGCLARGYAGFRDLGGHCECGACLVNAGPLWTGSFADKGFCEYAARQEVSEDVGDIAERVLLEQDFLTPYYDLHALCKRAKLPPPGFDRLREGLGGLGAGFSRTHFSPTGFRTGLESSSVLGLVKDLRQ
jgi:tRNA (guanine26-N2/guanine27-N2)-dimethyltransferase